jgi:hypothetical protein
LRSEKSGWSIAALRGDCDASQTFIVALMCASRTNALSFLL